MTDGDYTYSEDCRNEVYKILIRDKKDKSMREQVLGQLRRRYSGGMTSKEISRSLGLPLHHISGRLTELSRKGLIMPTYQRREGCCVWEAIQ